MNLYRFFPAWELACRCGCGRGQNDMDPGFMVRLIGLRESFGRALPAGSAFRCPDHNANVSATGRTGPHTTGRAVDIRIFGASALRLVELAIRAGFTGIGVGQKGDHNSRIIHLDDLGPSPAGPRPWIWAY